MRHERAPLHDFPEYDRLYANRPATTRGRINRAILLIRGGWANMRAYDDCVEMGDG